MTKQMLLDQLRAHVTPDEWDILTRQAAIILPLAGFGAAACMPEASEDLKAARQPWMLPINAFNLQQYMEMKDLKIPKTDEKDLDEEQVEGCRRTLTAFLQKVFSEDPSAWKWIIDSCIYLAFIAERPMHPVEVLKIQTQEEGGGTVYRCPGKMQGEDSCCAYCVCEPI